MEKLFYLVPACTFDHWTWGLTGCAWTTDRQDGYIPPKRPYSFLAMLEDILQFAADHLIPGGRLCFWMPTANEDFSQLDIPTHPELEIVSVCVQEFNKCTPYTHYPCVVACLAYIDTRDEMQGHDGY